MSRLRLKFVQAWVDGDGRVHHYFRRAGYPRTRLPGLPGSLEFMAAYQAALGGQPEPIGAGRSKPGSVAAAIASYYGSAAFTKNLAPDTQGVRRAVLDAFGRELVRAMPTKFLRALLGAMQPTAAKNWLSAIRALAQHCIKVGLLDDDPTVGIKLGLKAGEPRGSPQRATPPDCRAHAPSTGCARRRRYGSRMPDAPRTRSWPSLATLH
jgi:hypothetical protein